MRRRRKAYSLIECLVMILLIGTTLIVSARVLHALHRADQRMRDGYSFERTLQRFVGQLRLDCHQAEAASLEGDATNAEAVPRLQLAHPEGTSIEYAFADGGVERIVRRDDAVAHRETYSLHFVGTPAWELRSVQAASQVVVHVSWSDSAPGQKRATSSYSFNAAVGTTKLR